MYLKIIIDNDSLYEWMSINRETALVFNPAWLMDGSIIGRQVVSQLTKPSTLTSCTAHATEFLELIPAQSRPKLVGNTQSWFWRYILYYYIIHVFFSETLWNTFALLLLQTCPVSFSADESYNNTENYFEKFLVFSLYFNICNHW